MSMESQKFKNRLPQTFLLMILIVSVIIVTGGVIVYKSQRNKIIREKQNELAAIATLKVSNIVKWREEHLRDGEILKTIIPENQEIFSFFKHDGSREFGKDLVEILRIFLKNYDYHSVIVIDTTGSVVLIYPPSETHVGLKASQARDLQIQDVVFSDLHFSDDLPHKIEIDMQVPLISHQDNRRVRLGTLLISIDPEKVLYPLVQSWPTPSKSSETYIVRDENDSVLFLNELRHMKNTALRLKLPKRDDLAAAAALTGHQGVFEGVDYRGIPVISYLMKIPDSPWSFAAKVDKKEIYSPLNEIVIAILAGIILLIFSFILIIFYIWRKQRIKYLNELNFTKDKFFSIVSHDLMNPFTSINGFADLLFEYLRGKDSTHIDPDRITKYVSIIKESSQNAVDLLKNIVLWSRLQTGRMKLNPHPFDLVAITNNEIDLMNVTAIQKSINFSKSFPSELQIYADQDMISLVIRNLISNAIKFSYPNATVHLSILEQNDEVIVSVYDNGVGIKQESVDKLFRIEEHVTTPGTNKESGTGLGLILVKEFISLHDGKVSVESEEGKYTRFSFALPLKSRNQIIS